jgi:hypothetical protein
MGTGNWLTSNLFRMPVHPGKTTEIPASMVLRPASEHGGERSAPADICPGSVTRLQPGMTACMIAPQDGTRYSVRLSVPRNGGWRAWGAVSGDFERRLAEQESLAVIVPAHRVRDAPGQRLRPDNAVSPSWSPGSRQMARPWRLRFSGWAEWPGSHAERACRVGRCASDSVRRRQIPAAGAVPQARAGNDRVVIRMPATPQRLGKGQNR